MKLLEDIYQDVVVTLAMTGEDANRSLCANELRSIRNKLEPLMSCRIIEDVARKADICRLRKTH